MKKSVYAVYKLLLKKNGYQNWWPAETKEEIIIGTILTQSVAWSNVEKAILNLKGKNILSLKAIHDQDFSAFSPLLKPTRFYNQKAKKLKNFCSFFYEYYDGDLIKMFHDSNIRAKLLTVNGIGEETADCILLYAGEQLEFVCDAYTRRIFSRLGFVHETIKYAELKHFFENALPKDQKIYNDFHAQIVLLGKTFCAPKPKCEKCLLNEDCKFFNTKNRRKI